MTSTLRDAKRNATPVSSVRRTMSTSEAEIREHIGEVFVGDPVDSGQCSRRLATALDRTGGGHVTTRSGGPQGDRGAPATAFAT